MCNWPYRDFLDDSGKMPLALNNRFHAYQRLGDSRRPGDLGRAPPGRRLLARVGCQPAYDSVFALDGTRFVYGDPTINGLRGEVYIYEYDLYAGWVLTATLSGGGPEGSRSALHWTSPGTFWLSGLPAGFAGHGLRSSSATPGTTYARSHGAFSTSNRVGKRGTSSARRLPWTATRSSSGPHVTILRSQPLSIAARCTSTSKTSDGQLCATPWRESFRDATSAPP